MPIDEAAASLLLLYQYLEYLSEVDVVVVALILFRIPILVDERN
jgi:hypothetical protein